ncbi:TPA: hypothetical protein DCY43_03155 [candidate division WWE3 bacterium]|uniref:Type IV pilus assembly protein PilM n=4 Tax=Katanobacteria TaxID=422282 RepID=A0A351JTU5_UNCKA|nr:MAG: putative type 4 fimbrial biogenesis protein [candidate division WWE3 bacterium GW2011_GWA2_44_16]KKT69495.1 MAG: putative type 4 fimbrial biogenesis protein [candidate division WWE3 bacterium GW2011_GWB1_44_4]KKT84968.1 MAG: putative type 4 fimbrial biogenesis protein [candidate division WWE3 bacterium GW2011_GWC2_44_9]HAZ29715.1 hypothetical protein [candidate division WWE3 bacterium]
MPSIIGLDLGNTSYRAVEVFSKSKSKNLTLEKAFVCSECVKENTKEAEEGFKHFIRDSGFATRDVLLSLPETKVFSTSVSLPFRDPKEIRNYLDIQGGKVFPKPVSEIVYSFQIVGPGEQNKSENEISIVACDRNFSESMFIKARSAGLRVLAVEPESHAVVRALMRNRTQAANEVDLIANIGANDTDTMVIKNGYVSFSRNVALGGIAMTKAISSALALSYEQAEAYKKSYGVEAGVLDDKVRKAILPVLESLINEIKRTMNFYFTRNNLCVFKRVVYTGGSSVMPGLLAYSAEMLDTEVELANPFEGLILSPKLENQKDFLIANGPLFSVAIGLALRDFI